MTEYEYEYYSVFQKWPNTNLKGQKFILVAFVWFISTVCFQMLPQIACLKGFKSASVTFIWFFSTVGFKMLTWRAWIRTSKVTVDLSSGCFQSLPMHNCISCICFAFFTASFQMSPLSKLKWDVIKVSLVAFVWSYSLCVFIYAFSKCLPEWMHIHTGCICLNFLHCDLSSGSTKQLPKRTEFYAGCICFAFNRCVFLNGSLNCLYWSMHSHICCICLTSPLSECLICALKA